MLTTCLASAILLTQAPAPQVSRLQTFDQFKAIALVGAPTGSNFAAALENGDVRIFDANKRATVFNLKGHPQPVYGIAFSPNGQEVVTGDETARIYVWNLKTGQKVREFPRKTEYHGRGIQGLAFSPDGQTLLSTGKDDVVIAWNYKTMLPKFRLGGNGVIFSNATYSGKSIAVATQTEGLHFRNSGNLSLTQKNVAHANLGVNELVVSRDGTRVYTAGRDGAVGIWASGNMSLVGYLKGGHSDWVQKIAISPNGQMVASSSNDRNVVLWSVKTMKKVGFIGDQSAVGSPITFTGDGKFLITTNINDSLQINSITPSQGVPTKAPVKRRRR